MTVRDLAELVHMPEPVISVVTGVVVLRLLVEQLSQIILAWRRFRKVWHRLGADATREMRRHRDEERRLRDDQDPD